MTGTPHALEEAEPLLRDDELSDEHEYDENGAAEASAIPAFVADGPAGPGKRVRWRGFPRIDMSRLQIETPFRIVILISFLKFALSTSGMLISLPLFRLIEDAFCHEHYQKHRGEPIDERLCKVDEVQRELAYLGGWAALISSVVSLVAAFPYGILADRIGRKPTFLLSYVGIIMAFSWSPTILWFAEEPNFYLLLCGSLFFLVGGGMTVAFNTLFAIAADVSDEKDRSSSFVYLSFGAVTGGLLGPVLAGALMEAFGPWVPILVVFSITPFILASLLFLPETLRVKLDGVPQEQLPLLQAAREHVRTGLSDLARSFSILKNANALLCFLPFIIQNPLYIAYSTTLTQYVSKYFGWKLAETSFLLSPLGFLHLAVLLVLPFLSKLLVNPTGRFRYSSFGKDMALTRLSILFLIVAALMEAFSREIVPFLIGLVVGTFGSAASPLGRAVVTEFVDPEQTSRLYALLSMVEVFGSFFGGPVLAWCFSTGMRKEGLWRGLPWFYVTFLCSLALSALMFVREPKKKAPVSVENQDGTDGLDYQSAGEEP